MQRKINIITGATASGKSAFALSEAKQADGIIINADSQQVFSDLPILTASPTPSEKEQVPHFLYNFASPRERLNAADWAQKAAEIINSTDKEIFIVGGTGFYIRALTDGLSPIPDVPLVNGSWAELNEFDNITAARLNPNDSQRISRAVSVYKGTGKPLSYWQSLPRIRPIEAEFDIKIISLPTAELNEKIAVRAEFMLANGAVDEVANLTAPLSAPIWKITGAKEIHKMLCGEISREACLQSVITKTCQYAKRQRTWFRNQL